MGKNSEPSTIRDKDCLRVGEYTITKTHDGDYLIEHCSGEGMQVFKLNFERLIHDYYKNEF